MSILNRRYQTSRWNDFWGWVNVRTSSDSIDDKQWTQGINMVSEWNKLTTINWYISYVTVGSWVSKWQAISLYSNYTLSIHNRNLYVYNTVTWTTYTKSNAVANAVDTYSIITSKSFTSWNISIVLINSNLATVEDVVAYEFDWALFTTPSFTSLTNKNFKCGAFHEGKLLLGGNPLYPSNLYYSKTGSVLWASATAIYDFSWYNSNFQSIWDAEAIVNIRSNNSELWVVKKNWFHKAVGTVDDWTSYLYQFKQESSTWALNTHCVVSVDKDIIYFDWVSIRRISYEQNISALTDSNISKDIESIIRWFPTNQENNATMYYAYPYVKLFLRDKFSDYNSVWVIYNVVDKSFSLQNWLSVIQWVGWFINNKRTSYFVSSQTSTIYEDNVWDTYSSWNINCSHKSKRYVLGDWVDYKRITQIELYWKISSLLSMYIDIYVNWLIIDTQEIYFDEVLVPTTWSSEIGNTLFGWNNEDNISQLNNYVVRYEYFADGRDLQFWVRWNGQWRFELHWLNVIYKSIKAYDIH